MNNQPNRIGCDFSWTTDAPNILADENLRRVQGRTGFVKLRKRRQPPPPDDLPPGLPVIYTKCLN